MRRRLAIALLAAALVAWFGVAPASAAPAPSWAISTVAQPTNFDPGSSQPQYYEVTAENRGAATTSGAPITIEDRLPAGLTVQRSELILRPAIDAGPVACKEEAGPPPVVRCELTPGIAKSIEATLVEPGEAVTLRIYVTVDPDTAGTLRNSVEVRGGARFATATSENPISVAPAAAGLADYEAIALDEEGQPVTRAGSHPFELTTRFAINTEPGRPGDAPLIPAGGNIKDFEIALPPGFVGNPNAASRCRPADFFESLFFQSANGNDHFTNSCPPGSVVGLIRVAKAEGSNRSLTLPIYNLVPPRGMPAQLGFTVLNANFYIDTRVRTGSDYGITGYLPNLTEVKRVTAAAVTLWGNPADPIHDPYRGGRCLNESPREREEGISFDTCPAGISNQPFFTMPTRCGVPGESLLSIDRWTAPGAFESRSSPFPAQSGCAGVPFSPSLSVVPRATAADTPTGFAIDVHLPQPQAPEGLATANLEDAVVAFPPGVAIDPASADGLAACSPAQVGLTSPIGATPVSFSPAPAACPAASKIGTVEVDTPLLDHPVEGGVFVASQGQNPFGTLLAVYLAAYDERTGVVLKLPGRVELDPASGRVVTRFDDNPQLPFEDLKVELFDGPRAPLRTPTTCGAYATSSDLRPYSASESGADATPSSSFAVGSGAGGGPCAASEAQLPIAPGLEAGTVSARAGAFSPFVLRLTRPDGSQRLSTLTARLPKGLLGSLRGIPYCSDAALASVSEGEGTGAGEATRPSCPAASRVGSVTVGAGAGPAPLFVDSGRAYLAGPYKGAPLSLAIVTPALAGPFDLGSVVVRTALRVDPETTQITAVSDPFPTILHGIPLDLREVRVALSRPDFTLNPTNCAPTATAATITGTAGGSAQRSPFFQAANCAGLGFEPRLTLRLKGGTKRNRYPALTATVNYPKRGGYANISRAVVALPHSEFLEQGHIGTVCTRVQFAAGKVPGEGCPRKSVYGRARAATPLLDRALAGKVYLRSSNHPLPDLVAVLHGQIDVVLVGRIDSVRGGIRTSFEGVPDAPVSKFTLALAGGKRGLLVNSTDICRRANRADARFVGQNGRVQHSRPKLLVRCGKKKGGHGKRAHGEKGTK